MSFVKIDSDFLMDTFTLVDNVFLNEYLPSLNEKQIKVYLYGLFLATTRQAETNIDTLCTSLNMTESEIVSAYEEFEDLGLVRIVNKTPLEVSYLSRKRSNQIPKKYKSEKWSDFNAHLQRLFPERMLTPNEYNEYYAFLDDSKMSPDALIMIVQYCIDLKGMNVRYPYILTVARNWANDGVKTISDVEDKLKEYDTQTEDMRQILSALGRKGSAELEEKQLLQKWTRSWGYDITAILAAAKQLKGSKTFAKLDARLDEFFRASIFTKEDMDAWKKKRDELKDLAIDINKTIGVYYDSVEHEIEVYIKPWIDKGFENDAITKIAHYCFISNIRTLDGMNGVVNKFYKSGLLSVGSIDDYLKSQLAVDEKIKEIIKATGRTRSVTQNDRDFYRTWSSTWGFDDEVILYAAELALGKPYPQSFINQTLSSFKTRGVKTVEEAKKQQFSTASKTPERTDEKIYTQEELRSIAQSLGSLDDDDL